jgi:outer membrane lipoprotein SlyB
MQRTSLSLLTVAALAAITGLAGCAAPQAANHYARQEARMVHQVYLGVITEVREVVIDGTPTGQGAAAGAVLGGIPGAQSGNATRAAIGGVFGSLLGQGIEGAASKSKGLELLVKLDSGSSVSVTQEVDGLNYAPGQRVRVLSMNGSARVVHHTERAAAQAEAATKDTP